MTRPASTARRRAPKTVTDSRVEISRLMRPQDGNFAGNVHGGILLGLMDEVAYLCASWRCETELRKNLRRRYREEIEKGACTLEMVSAASPPVGRSP